tara:strand:- start:5 stop:217 length:213 start_codon:yes stop_codon:yes gene_type:complete
MVSKKDKKKLKRVLKTSRDYDDLFFGAQEITSVDRRMSRRDLSARYAESKGISQFDRLFSYLENIIYGKR